MLYKQAWEELKEYLSESWLPADERIRKNLLAKMKQLEERWKLIPKEGNHGNSIS